MGPNLNQQPQVPGNAPLPQGQPQQPVQGAPMQQPVAGQAPAPAQYQNPASATQDPDFYRQYWIFAAIIFLAPFGILFGIYVLLSGTIFKKKNGVWQAISNNGKTALIVVSILLQGFGIFRAFS